MVSNVDSIMVHVRLNDYSVYIDGLVQYCSISIALAMEIQPSCTKPLILDMACLSRCCNVNVIVPKSVVENF